MIRPKTWAAVVTVVFALAIPAAAIADSCANVSRPPPQGYTPGQTYTELLVVGNWLWLPSLSAVGETGLPPLWGFEAPANFAGGKTVSLLGVSAICEGRGNALLIRQTEHGIQTGCLDSEG